MLKMVDIRYNKFHRSGSWHTHNNSKINELLINSLMLLITPAYILILFSVTTKLYSQNTELIFPYATTISYLVRSIFAYPSHQYMSVKFRMTVEHILKILWKQDPNLTQKKSFRQTFDLEKLNSKKKKNLRQTRKLIAKADDCIKEILKAKNEYVTRMTNKRNG